MGMRSVRLMEIKTREYFKKVRSHSCIGSIGLFAMIDRQIDPLVSVVLRQSILKPLYVDNVCYVFSIHLSFSLINPGPPKTSRLCRYKRRRYSSGSYGCSWHDPGHGPLRRGSQMELRILCAFRLSFCG